MQKVDTPSFFHLPDLVEVAYIVQVPDERKPLTTGEIAKALSCSRQTVVNWIERNQVPFERVGKGRRRITVENARAFAQANGMSMPEGWGT